MAIVDLKKFKISSVADAKSRNTLKAGDIVRRQYFDGQDSIYTVMYVESVGEDEVVENGESKVSSYFIGLLLYGDEPKSGEILDFVRVTSLSDPHRSGALYLTSSDNSSPYMDIVDGFTRENAVFCPDKVGSGGYQPIYAGTSIDFLKSDNERYRIARFTNSGSSNKLGMSVKSDTMRNDDVWLVSFKAKANKSTDCNFVVKSSKGTDANKTYEVTSTIKQFFIPVTTNDIDLAGREVELSFDGLGIKDDYVEISDFVIVQLSTITKLSGVTKVRVGLLDGIYDSGFGQLDGYGGYFQKLFATKDVNVSGTITAGDKDGSGATFYAGKIHKNLFKNSLGVTFTENDALEVSYTSPVGIGNVFTTTKEQTTLIGQSEEWCNKNEHKEVCFSLYVKTDEDKDVTIQSNHDEIFIQKIFKADGWTRVYFSFFIKRNRDVKISLMNKDVFFTAPQMEYGDKPSLYQATDNTLNYTDEYGAWMSRGGFGGTIQNPLLKLGEDGSIESKGSGFRIDNDGTGHLAGGAIKFDKEKVNISFENSNIGGEIQGVEDRLDSKIKDVETNFEIKEGQISSSVKEVREKSEQISSLGNQIKTVGEQASKDAQTAKDSATNAKSSFLSAQEEATRAKEQATNAQTDAIKAKTQAEDAQKKAELASLKAEEALKSADGSSQSYLQAKENAELAKKDALLAKEKAELAQAEAGLAKLDADRAKTEADRASSIKTSIVELETSVTQTAEKVEANATKVEENVSLSNQSVLDAQAQADKAIDSATDAYNNALDASKKAKEALNSAGLSSEEYKKAKLEAEKANADALKAQSEAEKAQDKANEVALSEQNITEMEANILLTAEGIESQVTKVDTIAKHVDENALLAQSNALLAKKNAESAVSSAEDAATKAEEASLKAEEALASAGASSQSYLDALAEAKKAKADAVKANSDAQKALDEANRAKEEADKAELVAVDVTEKYTSIQQTADEIALTATEVQTNLDISNEAIEKTAQNVADAKKQAESATLKATEANEKALLAQKKADEAKASAGKSSTEYLNAKAEAEKAKADAVKANTKAEEANQSALDVAKKAQEVADALTTVIEKETSITQTAEEIVSIATSVNADATSANEAVKKAIAEATKSANSALEAQTNASSSKAQAEEAAKKALEATEKAEEALENAGASSESYLLAKKEAELAVKEAEKATEQAELSQTKADLATEEADRAKEEADKAALVGADVTEKYTEISQTADEIKSTATKVTTDAETAEASATKATAEATKSATNAANAKKDALSAKTQATNAQTKALEAAAKAEEALASAGESSESYLKAKTEAELAVKEAEKATEQAELSQTKAELATKEANRAKSEADKAVLLNEDVTEKYTEISQTADEIALTATEVQTNAKKATDASLKAQADAEKANADATKATKEALDAATKAEEALASAGASSKSYLDAKAEAENALKRANDANAKAKEASESATASQNALTEVKSAQTAINQTAKEITLSAQQVSGDVQKVSDFVDTAKTNADLATAEAIKANAKALEAEQKAKDALASAGQSSASYKNALAEAERAKKEAVTASEKATQASKDAQKAIESANKAIDAEASINLKADGIVMEASQKAADKAIDGLEIGGRNLYTNSDFSKGLDDWSFNALQLSVESNVLKVVGGGSNSSRFYRLNTEPIGTTLTLSFEVKSDTDALLNIGQGSGSSSVASIDITNRDWVKKVFTTDVVNSYVLYSYTVMTPDSTLYFRNFKLEKGNKATDWTPAPEDIDAQFTETNSNLSVLSDKIVANTTSIEQTEKRLKTAETTISQQGDQIALKASKKEVDKVSQEVKDNKALIDVNSQGITLAQNSVKEVKDDLDNLEIGGRNYLTNSMRVDTSSGYATRRFQETLYAGEYILSFLEIESSKIDLPETYSCQIIFDYGEDSKEVVHITIGREKKHAKIVTKTDHSFAFIYSGSGWVESNNRGVVYKMMKLESGNKPTDWAPAPEDIDSKFEETEARIDITDGKIDSNTKLINESNKRLSTAETKILQHEDKISLTASKTELDKLTGDVVKNTSAINQNSKGIELSVKSNKELKEELDNLEIGGRNLIIRSSEEVGTWVSISGDIVTSANHSTTDYIKVEPSNTYSLSKIPSVLVTEGIGGYWRYAWYDEDKVYISRRAETSLHNLQWTIPSNAHYVRLSYPIDSQPKFEKGNKATDWTPAPEDLVAEAVSKSDAKLTVTANEIRGEVNTNKKDADGKITSLNTRVSQTEDKISQTVSKTEYNANNQAIGSKITKIEQDTSKITLDVTNNKKDADDKIIGLNSRITVAEKNINLKVSQTDYNAHNAEVSEKFASIDVKADKIELKVDSIEIGGRNYAVGFKDEQVVSTGYANNFGIVPVKPNDYITVSFYVKSDADYTGNLFIHQFHSAESPSGSQDRIKYQWLTATIGTEFTYYEETLQVPDNPAILSYTLGQRTPTGVVVYVKKVKLEKGNKPTDWSPAPEDIDAQFAENEAKIEVLEGEIKSTVKKNEFDKLTGRVSTAESKITQTEDEIKGLVTKTEFNKETGSLSTEISKISQKSDGISMRVSETEKDLSTVDGRIKDSIDEIEIGGRNLVKTVRSVSFLPTFHVTATKSIIDDTTVPSGFFLRLDNYTKTGSTDGFYFPGDSSHYTESLRNKRVTISFYMRGDIPFLLLGNIEIGTEWTKVVYTRRWSNTGNMHLFSTNADEIGLKTMDLSSIKIEKGNKATDWSPAPEDIDAQFAENEAKIEVLEGEIKSTVKKNEFDKLTGRVSTAESKITQTEDEIKGLVTKTEFNKETGSLSTEISKISQKSDGISMRVSETEKDLSTVDGRIKKSVDDIKIGGKNLIIRTNEKVGMMINPSGDEASFSSSALMNQSIEVNPGEVLSFSLIKKQYGSDNYWRYAYYNENDGVVSRYARGNEHFIETVPSGSKYMKVSYPKDGVVKLERGNKPTDWTPAPEDTFAEIQILKDSITSTVSSIDKLDTRISKVTQESDKFQVEITKKIGDDINANNEKILSSFTVSDNTISMLGKDISLTGKISFNSLDLSTKSKINNALSDSSKALSDVREVDGKIINRNYIYQKTATSDSTLSFYLSNDFPRTGDHKVTLSIWGDFSGYQNESPYDEIMFQGNMDSQLRSYKYKWKSDNHIVYEGGTLNLYGDSDPNTILSLGFYEGTDIEVRAVKLEMGDKATAWIPSPEDTIGLASLDETIIDGGFIKTSLIKANSITADKIDVNSIFAKRITTGNLTVTDGAKIGGWTVSNNSLSTKDILIDPSGGIKNTNGHWSFNPNGTATIGRNNELSVSTNGVKIGGFDISPHGLTSADDNTQPYVIISHNNNLASIGSDLVPSVGGGGMNVTGVFNCFRKNNDPYGANVGIEVGAKGAYDNGNIAIKMVGGHISGHAIRTVQIDSSYTCSNADVFISCYNTSSISVTLPYSPTIGKVIYVSRNNKAHIDVKNTQYQIRRGGGRTTSIPINNNGEICFFVFDGQVWQYGYMLN